MAVRYESACERAAMKEYQQQIKPSSYKPASSSRFEVSKLKALPSSLSSSLEQKTSKTTTSTKASTKCDEIFKKCPLSKLIDQQVPFSNVCKFLSVEDVMNLSATSKQVYKFINQYNKSHFNKLNEIFKDDLDYLAHLMKSAKIEKSDNDFTKTKKIYKTLLEKNRELLKSSKSFLSKIFSSKITEKDFEEILNEVKSLNLIKFFDIFKKTNTFG